MKRWTQALCLMVCGTTLVSPMLNNTNQIEAKKQSTTEESQNNSDQVVEIDPETKFLEMTAEDKAKAYEKLDQIELTSQEIKPVPKYSQVKAIHSAEEYQRLIDQSKEKPFIIYLGFDECPYCRAFLPKLNHLAQEFDLDIHYYNTTDREKDENFADVVNFFKVQTVPHTFIIQKGKVIDQINNNNTMKEIEAFLISFKDLK